MAAPDAIYHYRDESGQILHQKLRYNLSDGKKRFVQRRPDAAGTGWIENLTGVRKLVYRLPELKGKNAILFLEGEKDVDASWAMGIPATCNRDGSSDWDQAYATQVKAQGVLRVAVIPDDDEVGVKHALAVASGLTQVGIEVRYVVLPGTTEHGDLSDWLKAGHTKDELLSLVKATPVWVPPVLVSVEMPPRNFQALGEQRYTLAIYPEGVVLELNRLRRSSHELNGELIVRVNGYFPNARTFADGILSVGDLNLSSVVARGTRAKLLSERSGDKAADWHGFVEEFVTSVIAAERRGKPAEVLADAEVEDEDNESWTVEGFPLLQNLPQIIFGDASSGKSYFAMWLAGVLAERDIPVLYADWEFSQSEHKKRLQRLFQPMPRNLRYLRCEHPLRQEADHLIDVVQKNKIQYIICDSIGFAVEGPAEAQEGASGYFRHLRQLRIGSLNVAHIPKQYEDNREAQIFGSVFFKAGARSVWFIERAKENPQGEVRFGLYHRKNNVGSLLQPKGFKLVFRGERTLVEAIDLHDVEELAAGYPLLDRLKGLLVSAPLTLKAISEELNVSMPILKSTLARHRSQFVKVGNKVSVGASKESDNAAEF